MSLKRFLSDFGDKEYYGQTMSHSPFQRTTRPGFISCHDSVSTSYRLAQEGLEEGKKKFCSRLFLVCVWLGKEHAQNCVSNVVFAACLKFSHHKFCGKLRGSCRSGTRFDSRFPWAISLCELSHLYAFPFTFTSKRFIIKRSEFRIDWEPRKEIIFAKFKHES